MIIKTITKVNTVNRETNRFFPKSQVEIAINRFKQNNIKKSRAFLDVDNYKVDVDLKSVKGIVKDVFISEEDHYIYFDLVKTDETFDEDSFYFFPVFTGIVERHQDGYMVCFDLFLKKISCVLLTNR